MILYAPTRAPGAGRSADASDSATNGAASPATGCSRKCSDESQARSSCSTCPRRSASRSQRAIEEVDALLRWQVERGVEHALDLCQRSRSGLLTSPRSVARASGHLAVQLAEQPALAFTQSRRTVRAVTPSAAAVSSSVRPPK
jgi:hypothetical protein